MNTPLRILSEQGKTRFAAYLTEVRLGSSADPPIRELGYAPWSTEFVPTIELDDIDFPTRITLGKYLTEKFNAVGIDRRQLFSNDGIWSWMALVWFNKICPIIEGKRRIRDDSHYIYVSDYRDSHRHLLAASWMLYDLHHEQSRLFLDSPLYITNDFIEHVADNQDIITNGPLISVFDSLYWDRLMSKAKAYAANRHNRGNIRRFVSLSRQLSLTYDLRSMEPTDIINLLGDEFKPWSKAK